MQVVVCNVVSWKLPVSAAMCPCRNGRLIGCRRRDSLDAHGLRFFVWRTGWLHSFHSCLSCNHKTATGLLISSKRQTWQSTSCQVLLDVTSKTRFPGKIHPAMYFWTLSFGLLSSSHWYKPDEVVF